MQKEIEENLVEHEQIQREHAQRVVELQLKNKALRMEKAESEAQQRMMGR